MLLITVMENMFAQENVHFMRLGILLQWARLVSDKTLLSIYHFITVKYSVETHADRRGKRNSLARAFVIARLELTYDLHCLLNNTPMFKVSIRTPRH